MDSITPDKPGLEPPPGQPPNFDHPWSIDNVVYGFSGLFFAVTTITMAMRSYTKFLVTQNPGWDDYTMIVAWVVFLSFNAVLVIAVGHGAGKHQWDVRFIELETLLRLKLAGNALYSIGICLVKVSICLQFLHIFVTGHYSIEFNLIWVFVLLQIMFFLFCFWIGLFWCNPWKTLSSPTTGKCPRKGSVLLIAISVFNMISDALMLTYPLVRLSRLQLPRRKKVNAGAAFLVGLVALLASTIRLVFNIENLYHNEAQTFIFTQVAMCTVAEVAAGIVAGNNIMIPRFFIHIGDKMGLGARSQNGHFHS